jgi:glutamyl-tRNA reductase
MRDLLALLAHLMTIVATLLGPGGVKAVVAESLLLKHQLLIINRARRRAPNLCAVQRLLLGFWFLVSASAPGVALRRDSQTLDPAPIS